MTTRRVTLASGIELDVDDQGPRDAPALIFLHGFPENRRTWRHQIAHLADRFRCIAPDQRGYAGSSKPAGVEHYAPQALVGDVFQLADALGIARFTVIGHDWGGAIAWAVALWGQPGAPAGGRVERLVIANAPHPALFQHLLFTHQGQRLASQYIRRFRDPAVDPLVAAHGLKAAIGDAFGKAPPEPEEAALREAQWADPVTAISMLNWYRASAMQVPPPEAPYEVPAGYQPAPIPRLTVPTLVIWGMDDHALPPANLDGLGGHVSDLRVVEVPGAGHFVPWEAPDAVNAAIDAFLG
ncbi:MAG: alpha/beta hydrolase [Proteobacteria bacterium]|nr:alpha/beta hydrolase [Pseudomonadota bacterium]